MKLYISLIFTLLIALSTIQAQEGTPDIIRGDERFSLVIKTENDTNYELVNDVEVYLYETKTDLLLESKMSVDGVAAFEIDPGVEYEIRTCHPEYLRNGLSIFECNEGNEVLCSFGGSDYNFVAAGGKDKPLAFFSATLSMTPITVGSVFELDNVYYDLDKAYLKLEAQKELDELAKIMKRNESITIELSSHTDSRASDEYNMDLSQRRADACYSYLLDVGIDPSRIETKGYGESKLINACTDNVSCSEYQHQQNRRTEIKVLTFEKIECEPSTDIDFQPKDLKNDPENTTE